MQVSISSSVVVEVYQPSRIKRALGVILARFVGRMLDPEGYRRAKALQTLTDEMDRNDDAIDRLAARQRELEGLIEKAEDAVRDLENQRFTERPSAVPLSADAVAEQSRDGGDFGARPQ